MADRINRVTQPTVAEVTLTANKANIKITVIADAIAWLAVVGNLQLALRHPKNTGDTAGIVREFAEQVLNKLEQEAIITHELSAVMFEEFR